MILPHQTGLLQSRVREVKFFLPMGLAVQIREWARNSMPADSHVPAGNQDQYLVTSLYFDTPQWDVFHKQGSYGRSKYRIRCYGDDRVAFLERKIKTCGQISKWRSAIPLEEFFHLTRPFPNRWSGAWFHRRIRLRRLEPVCRIHYRRLAREHAGRFGRFRLTLDEAIHAETIDLPWFVPRTTRAAGVDCCPEGMVLELKFGETMPALFKQLLEEFQLSESPFSKYRSAVAKLGLSPNPISFHA